MKIVVAVTSDKIDCNQGVVNAVKEVQAKRGNLGRSVAVIGGKYDGEMIAELNSMFASVSKITCDETNICDIVAQLAKEGFIEQESYDIAVVSINCSVFDLAEMHLSAVRSLFQDYKYVFISCSSKENISFSNTLEYISLVGNVFSYISSADLIVRTYKDINDSIVSCIVRGDADLELAAGKPRTGKTRYMHSLIEGYNSSDVLVVGRNVDDLYAGLSPDVRVESFQVGGNFEELVCDMHTDITSSDRQLVIVDSDCILSTVTPISLLALRVIFPSAKRIIVTSLGNKEVVNDDSMTNTLSLCNSVLYFYRDSDDTFVRDIVKGVVLDENNSISSI